MTITKREEVIVKDKNKTFTKDYTDKARQRQRKTLRPPLKTYAYGKGEFG